MNGINSEEEDSHGAIGCTKSSHKSNSKRKISRKAHPVGQDSAKSKKATDQIAKQITEKIQSAMAHNKADTDGGRSRLMNNQ